MTIPMCPIRNLEQRLRDTFVARSTAANKRQMYDSYKLAIRWASDRIGEEGVVAFVTNGSFIDGNAESGLRGVPRGRIFPSVCSQPAGGHTRQHQIPRQHARRRRQCI